MKFIIKPFAEIIVKSKPVRRKYLSHLQNNLNISLSEINDNCYSKFSWDRWEVITSDLSKDQENEIVKKLSRTPWIESFLEVLEFKIWDFDYIFSEVLINFLDKIVWKTFAVRVKRSWSHSFSSTDLERYIWAWLLKNSTNSKVDLKNPEVTINLEVKQDKFYLVNNKYFWIWWYPTWTQDKVLSLISWWFDSWVATYSMIKRWVKLDYLFFNLWWKAHELGVKQVSNYLRKNFSIWYKAKFVTINFEKIVYHLLKDINHKYRWIILKRLFLRVADVLSKEYEYYAIIKWDSLGQVSSQTLKNMFVIDKATDTLVLRPLISFNKQEIVDLSKVIWTYDFACSMPEYCWVISDKPSTWAKLEDILEEEKKLDYNLLYEAINNKEVKKIDEVLFYDESDNINSLDISYIPLKWEVIIDIREEEKEKNNPLNFDGFEILKIPFFDINYEFSDLNQTKTYLLYCEKWVLSKNHWEFLKSKWYNNIKIFRPILNDSSCRIKTWK